MNFLLRRSFLFAVLALSLAACSNAPTDLVEAGCTRYCDGLVACSGECTLTIPEADFLAECQTRCTAQAATLTTAELEQTDRCMTCLESQVDPAMCDDDVLGVAGFAGACSADCAGAPIQFLMDDATAFDYTTVFTCS